MSRPRCGGRSDLDLRVLNDVWVSQPVGSEETNSFKHARKNCYEEELFKCEDERFELDMVIDANAAAIATLELIDSEVKWTLNSTKTPSACTSTGLTRIEAPLSACAQLVGHVVKPVALSAAHLNAILRVYGEHGLELLELLYKNPRETISIVLKRLKQKGKEWRKLQGDMSDRWKEQLSLNSRRAADNLSHQKEPKIILPRHFMHDSLGTPDDPTQPGVGDSAMSLKYQFEMQLQLGHHAIHHALFHLIFDTAEQSSMSRHDKNHIVIFLRHFFAPFVHLSKHDTMAHLAQSESRHLVTTLTNVEFDANDRDPHKSSRGYFNAHEGTHDRKQDLCSDPLVLLGELTPAELRASYKAVLIHDEAGIQAGFSKSTNWSLVCTQDIYIFFRLYHLLFQRLRMAYELCHTNDSVPRSSFMDDCRSELDFTPTHQKPFEVLVSMVYGLMDGSLDASCFEDGSRCILGIEAHEVFSVDKLIVQVLKQLQLIIHDTASCKFIALWQLERERRRVDSSARTPIGETSHQCIETRGRQVLQWLGRDSDPLYVVKYCVEEKTTDTFSVRYLGCKHSDETGATAA
jgi:paired amphipathic helix protein Sin3a